MHGGVGQPTGDIIDNDGAGRHGGLGGGRVDGVHGDDGAGRGELRNDRQDSGLLLGQGDGSGPGASGLPANVEDVGALRNQVKTVGNSAFGP